MSHLHGPGMAAAAADATPSGCLVAPFAQVLQTTRDLVQEAFQGQLAPTSGAPAPAYCFVCWLLLQDTLGP
jgi:hypothetical protein